MKAGVRAKDVYAAALAYVKEKKPELEASFPKTLGHGVRESREWLKTWSYRADIFYTVPRRVLTSEITLG